jgi:hypothetical protein
MAGLAASVRAMLAIMPTATPRYFFIVALLE